MEGSGKKMRAICVILVIMLGMFAREAEAFSGKCYAKCLFFCLIIPFNNPAFCPIKCLGKCIFKPLGSSGVATLSLNDQLHKQCTFGCAKTKCANITTSNITTSSQNIHEDEVEGCVNNCSNACIRKH